MKILLYGACHATSFEKILKAYGPPAITTDRIHNWELMAANTPFPYEQLANYDACVFSPIHRAGDYNTARLLEVCADKGVQTVAYPLVEWIGCTPGIATYDNGKAYRYYPELIRLALEFDSFAAYEGFIVDGHEVDGLEAHVARCTKILRRLEEFGDTQITCADFIEAGFREHRMMLTKSHPARALYVDMARQLAEILGIRMDPSLYHGAYEPATGAKDPILPAVVRGLGLLYSDCEFQNSVYFGTERAWSLREWLRMYYYGARQATVFEAKKRTYLKRRLARVSDLPKDDLIPIGRGDMILALCGDYRPGFQKIHFLDGTPAIEPGSELFLYPPDWSRYDFRPPAPRSRAVSATLQSA
jgi:hypothetical protein